MQKSGFFFFMIATALASSVKSRALEMVAVAVNTENNI